MELQSHKLISGTMLGNALLGRHTEHFQSKITMAVCLIASLVRSRQYKDELATDQSAVMDAIKYINQKTEQLNTLKMLDERIEGIDKEAKEEVTASGVF